MKKFKALAPHLYDTIYNDLYLLAEVEPVNKDKIRYAILVNGKVNKFAYTYYHDTVREAYDAAVTMIDNGTADEIKNLPF